MADKKIKIIVEAQNNTRAGLSGASADVESFGKTSGQSFGQLATKVGVIAAIGIGIKKLGDLAVGAVADFMQQEKAERNLADAIKMHGESVSAVLPSMNAFSSAMQAQTGVGDEVTMQRMANLKAMGMETSALETGAKAVAALTRAGMGEEAAQRALVSASQGNFEALGRYIPALKTATTETEKAQAVNEFLSSQFAMLKADVKTTGGAWNLLKNTASDFSEEAGRAISKTLHLNEVFGKLTNAIKGITPDNSAEIAKMAEDYDKAAKEAKEKFVIAQADMVKAEEEASKKRREIAKKETEIKSQQMEQAAIAWQIQVKENEKIASKSVEQFIQDEKDKKKAMGSVTDQKRYDKLKDAESKGRPIFKSDLAFMTEMERKGKAFKEDETPEQRMAREKYERLKAIQDSGNNAVSGLGLKSQQGGRKLSAADQEFLKSFETIDKAKMQKEIGQNNLDQIERTKQRIALENIQTSLDDNLRELRKLQEMQ